MSPSRGGRDSTDSVGEQQQRAPEQRMQEWGEPAFLPYAAAQTPAMQESWACPAPIYQPVTLQSPSNCLAPHYHPTLQGAAGHSPSWLRGPGRLQKILGANINGEAPPTPPRALTILRLGLCFFKTSSKSIPQGLGPATAARRPFHRSRQELNSGFPAAQTLLLKSSGQ
ncbi:unnamed protein product [Eretmochelys imbricata]